MKKASKSKCKCLKHVENLKDKTIILVNAPKIFAKKNFDRADVEKVRLLRVDSCIDRRRRNRSQANGVLKESLNLNALYMELIQGLVEDETAPGITNSYLLLGEPNLKPIRCCTFKTQLCPRSTSICHNRAHTRSSTTATFSPRRSNLLVMFG